MSCHKGVYFHSYETVNIDLKNKPSWLFEKNPLGLVPVLEIDDKIVYESTATSDWLDDIYPQDRLQPSDPYRRAWDRIVTEYYGKFASDFLEIFRNSDNSEKAIANIQKHYQFFENVLAKRKGPFFGDDRPALVDLLIWPHFERVPVLATVDSQFAINKEKYPRLTAWYDAVLALPAVQAIYIDSKVQLQFYNAYISGDPYNDLE